MDKSLILKINPILYEEKKDVILEFFDTDLEEMKIMLNLMISQIPSLTTTIIHLIMDLKLIKNIDIIKDIEMLFDQVDLDGKICILRILKALNDVKFLILKTDVDFKFLSCASLNEEILEIKNKYQFNDERKNKIIELNSKEICEYLKNLNENVTADMIAYLQIIKNFSFDRNSCVLNLLKFSNDYDTLSKTIIWAFEEHNIQTMYLISIILSLIKQETFLDKFLNELTANNSEFRKIFLPILFEQKEVPDYELKKHVSKSDLKEFLKICNKERVKQFFSKNLEDFYFEDTNSNEDVDDIQIEDVMNEDKKIFFENFCKISKLSITHFLSYLEVYQDNFCLNKDEQKMFLEIFFKINNSFVYRNVIFNKLVKFNIIDKDLCSEYSEFLK